MGTTPQAAGPREWELHRHRKDNLSVYRLVRLTNRKTDSSSQLFLNWTIEDFCYTWRLPWELGVKLVIVHAKAGHVYLTLR